MALDLSKAPPPPPAKKTRASNTSSAASTSRVSAKTAEREEGINGLAQIGAMACMMMGQAADGAAVAQHAPAIAHETALIAESNEKFGRIIDYITAAGPYAALLTACTPLILQILVNHKRLPVEPLAQFGVVSPDVLIAKVSAEAAAAQAKTMLEVRQAEREYAEALSKLQEDAA